MVRDEDIRVRLTASTDEDQPVQTEDIYADGKKRPVFTRFVQYVFIYYYYFLRSDGKRRGHTSAVDRIYR